MCDGEQCDFHDNAIPAYKEMAKKFRVVLGKLVDGIDDEWSLKDVSELHRLVALNHGLECDIHYSHMDDEGDSSDGWKKA